MALHDIPLFRIPGSPRGSANEGSPTGSPRTPTATATATVTATAADVGTGTADAGPAASSSGGLLSSLWGVFGRGGGGGGGQDANAAEEAGAHADAPAPPTLDAHYSPADGRAGAAAEPHKVYRYAAPPPQEDGKGAPGEHGAEIDATKEDSGGDGFLKSLLKGLIPFASPGGAKDDGDDGKGEQAGAEGGGEKEQQQGGAIRRRHVPDPDDTPPWTPHATFATCYEDPNASVMAARDVFGRNPSMRSTHTLHESVTEAAGASFAEEPTHNVAGLHTLDIIKPVEGSIGLSVDDMLTIEVVGEGSPAARAGAAGYKGWTVTRCNGRVVSGPADLAEEFARSMHVVRLVVDAPNASRLNLSTRTIPHGGGAPAGVPTPASPPPAGSTRRAVGELMDSPYRDYSTPHRTPYGAGGGGARARSVGGIGSPHPPPPLPQWQIPADPAAHTLISVVPVA